MMINKDDCAEIIASLWVGEYPLTRQYFGPYLCQLTKALAANLLPGGRFVRAAYEPAALEQRLREIGDPNLISGILDEVKGVTDPVKLDQRLMDAWAELRTLSQLIKEGFSDLGKVIVTADITATRGEERYAVQVKRINNFLENHVRNINTPEMQDSTPYGDISDIHKRLDEPLTHFFRLALKDKNKRFANWTNNSYKRCIAIVSSDEDLQDALVRETACAKIQSLIAALPELNFEELLWLPDTGNGAWFIIDPTSKQSRCFVDWSDDPKTPPDARGHQVNRRELIFETAIEGGHKS